MFEERFLSTCRRTIPFHATLTIHSPPYGTTISTLSTTTLTDETLTYSLPEMKFANGNSINAGNYVVLRGWMVTIFLDFSVTFGKLSRPQKPRDFFGVLLVTLIFTMQVLLQDY